MFQIYTLVQNSRANNKIKTTCATKLKVAVSTNPR